MKTNFHTHTTFCDGKNTPEAMVCSAISKDFDMLGFSAHSMQPFDSSWHLRSERLGEYTDEIFRLKEKYAEKIKILHGFEADYIPGITLPTFEKYAEFKPDFLIGSIHYIYNNIETFAVDNTPQELENGIKTVFNGSVRNAVHEYFSLQKEMLDRGDFSIIGHPDLIRKFNGRLNFLDENESWYKDELKSLAQKIKASGVIAEINTGGISRGYMTNPYPSEYFLTLLFELGVPITISSDAHHESQLDGSFDLALSLAKKVGYSELAIPSKNKFDFYKI